jgi:hypothetical protein
MSDAASPEAKRHAMQQGRRHNVTNANNAFIETA